MFLKPDRLNGVAIFRGVETDGDGINHMNRVVLFPPSITTHAGPVLELGALVEQALASIVRVSDRTGDPVIKAQAATFRCDLSKALHYWMKRAAMNERTRCARQLQIHGLQLAATAIGELNG
jgi:hypothetical protein